jgi:hypothetical protein
LSAEDVVDDVVFPQHFDLEHAKHNEDANQVQAFKEGSRVAKELQSREIALFIENDIRAYRNVKPKVPIEARVCRH